MSICRRFAYRGEVDKVDCSKVDSRVENYLVFVISVRSLGAFLVLLLGQKRLLLSVMVKSGVEWLEAVQYRLSFWNIPLLLRGRNQDDMRQAFGPFVKGLMSQ